MKGSDPALDVLTQYRVVALGLGLLLGLISFISLTNEMSIFPYRIAWSVCGLLGSALLVGLSMFNSRPMRVWSGAVLGTLAGTRAISWLSLAYSDPDQWVVALNTGSIWWMITILTVTLWYRLFLKEFR